MKRYLASGGLILASLAYVVFQHFGGEDGAANRVVIPPTVPSADLSTTKTGTPFATSTVTTTVPVPVTVSVAPPPPAALYRDGSYTGTAANAYYGYVQVKAVITSGALTDVQILQSPNDRSTSRYINSQALPYLVQEAISAQSANVNAVSGASDSSGAFKQSLSSALVQAKA